MVDEFTKAALYWIKTFNKKVKEKIWMMKLIELLNEFETPQSWIVFKSYDDYDGTFYWVDIDGETEIARSDSYICGKRFQWVKWLVENDKIEWETIWNYQSRTKLRTLTHTAWLWHDAEWKSELEYIKETFTDGLLMLLSISDTPIEDLILYLK